MATKRTTKRTPRRGTKGTFERIQEILGDIVDRSVHEKIEDLEAFARQEPRNPGPLLVAVMVSSIARANHLETPRWLAEARARLVQADSSDPEMAFAAALYLVIEAELGLYQLRASPVVLHGRQELIERSAAANKDLMKAAKAVEHPLAEVIAAGVQALSQAHAIEGAAYKAGVRALHKRASSAGKLQDVAAFFLVYAHRRASDYRAALKVAHAMERRQPNSAMLKKMIGSCYQYGDEPEKAVSYYKQATTLAPNDPSTYLGLGRAYIAAAVEAERLVERNDAAAELANLRLRFPR